MVINWINVWNFDSYEELGNGIYLLYNVDENWDFTEGVIYQEGKKVLVIVTLIIRRTLFI